jgi:hypothetical protein
MHRLVFIVLWTVIFAIFPITASMITWDWLWRSGIATVWTQSTVDLIQQISLWTYFATPVIGMILGLFGKLPGTRLAKHCSHT